MLKKCCPAATAIASIPGETCAENFGQTQKIIFQRLYNGSTRNSLHFGAQSPAAGDAELYASWAALKEVNDSTKISVSPFIENPADDGGDARTYGGGNETLDGIEIVLGSNPINFTCRLNGKDQNIIVAMKSLMCEAQAGNLGVYLVNENGQVEGMVIDKDASGGYIAPFPIRKFFVGDKHHGGFDSPDYNDLSFSFVPGYSDAIKIMTLDQSALSL